MRFRTPISNSYVSWRAPAAAHPRAYITYKSGGIGAAKTYPYTTTVSESSLAEERRRPPRHPSLDDSGSFCNSRSDITSALREYDVSRKGLTRAADGIKNAFHVEMATCTDDDKKNRSQVWKSSPFDQRKYVCIRSVVERVAFGGFASVLLIYNPQTQRSRRGESSSADRLFTRDFFRAARVHRLRYYRGLYSTWSRYKSPSGGRPLHSNVAPAKGRSSCSTSRRIRAECIKRSSGNECNELN